MLQDKGRSCPKAGALLRMACSSSLTVLRLGSGFLSTSCNTDFRSTWNQRGNCNPILATVRLYRILQLDAFVFCPFTRTSIRPVDTGIQYITPSRLPTTLGFRSTKNQPGDCIPILVVMLLYRRIVQLGVFVRSPVTGTPRPCGYPRHHGTC
jgi:hypothetical protein